MTIDEAAAPPAPGFRRRREIGAASARSLLLTLLGEFVLPTGRPVWTAAFLRALALVGVEEKAARQALARSAAEGWLESARHGRRTAWSLTEAGRCLLTEGAERIYGFGTPADGWDGQWLIVLASVPESDRRLRHLLRTRLAWEGLGNLCPGVWVSPHPEREAAVREVLGEVGGGTVFIGRLGDVAEARRVAGQAWDLAEIELDYTDFLTKVGELRPEGPEQTFAAQVRLVQEWRRFPFLDPALPSALLDDRWHGRQAAELFRTRRAAWKPAANAYWAALVEPDSA